MKVHYFKDQNVRYILEKIILNAGNTAQKLGVHEFVEISSVNPLF